MKAGKKALTQEQTQLKASILMVLDGVRDESSKDAPVRLVFEPKSSRIEQQELITALLAHTSLESSTPINLTMIGIDGRPTQKSLRQMLNEWIEFRQSTITRRSQHRLTKVLDRIHILEGRQLVLLNIDEVIAIIRQSDDPKAALIERFKLSDRQAEDILEIRLRQLARLEAIKIEQELKSLREEQGKLEDILGNPGSLKRLMVKEIEADAKTFADARRTLIQTEKKAVAEIKVVDEPVTVVVSSKGWVRARTGHGHEAGSFAFKAGDGLYGTFECRTVDTLIVFGSNGRVYSVPVASLPGARGDGQPITTLIELESGTQPLHYFAGPANAALLLASSGGYGFLATVENMVSRQKAARPSSPGRGRDRLRAVARGQHLGRPAADRRHPRGLRLHRRPHPDLRNRRTQDHGKGRSRPDADRPGSQGHAGRRGGLHPQREDRRHRPRRQGARRNAGNPQPEQRPCGARPQRQGGRPGLQAQPHHAGGVSMNSGELTGVVIAAAVAVLAFGVTRFAVRHFARRRRSQG